MGFAVITSRAPASAAIELYCGTARRPRRVRDGEWNRDHPGVQAAQKRRQKQQPFGENHQHTIASPPPASRSDLKNRRARVLTSLCDRIPSIVFPSRGNVSAESPGACLTRSANSESRVWQAQQPRRMDETSGGGPVSRQAGPGGDWEGGHRGTGWLKLAGGGPQSFE